MTLLSRLSAAVGPDRELDAEIAKAVDFWPDGFCQHQPAPAYTGSLDAAMTLASDGEEYEISTLYGPAVVTLPLNRSDIDPITVRRVDGNVILAFVECAMQYRAALRARGIL